MTFFPDKHEWAKIHRSWVEVMANDPRHLKMWEDSFDQWEREHGCSLFSQRMVNGDLGLAEDYEQ
tara:strand:+ start:170 stop:364 length:195 start_codon:yes stop_codon:yes gene_type:complete